MPAANAQPHALACLEVWGGNEPVDTAVSVPGLDVWVYAVPFENAAAGGDVHFISSCGTGRIARLMVADVAGHGAEVAQTARTLRSLIRRYMNHIDQRQFVTSMNQAFTQLGQTGRFATAVAMTFFSPTGELTICNAGHPQPLLYRSNKKAWQYLDLQAETKEIENIPLGIMADVAYEQFKLQLGKDDLILFYTDSLEESVCRDGSLMGTDGLLDIANELAGDQPEQIIHHLLAKLSARGAVLNDDVTLVLSRCRGIARGAGFFSRLSAQLKFMGQVLTLQRDLPWPEWSLKNIGGSVIPSLGRKRQSPSH